MDFTREPIVESVITPREGCKLVVRSSKGVGQEEYFVDALEILSFGGCFFYRSLERPKAFLVPVSDYEVLEVRETRMVLKSASPERGSIKIAGGKATAKAQTEETPQKVERTEKKRRRSSRRRRGRDEQTEERQKEVEGEEEAVSQTLAPVDEMEKPVSTSIGSLLPPPQTLIRDSITKYREDEAFSKAFYDVDDDSEEQTESQDRLEEETSPQEEAVAKKLEDNGPFGEGDGLEDSGEAEKEELLVDDNHWIIPEVPSHESEANSSVDESTKT